MFQNDQNSMQGNTPLCMFLHCFICNGLVFLCHRCVSLPLHGPRSYFLEGCEVTNGVCPCICQFHILCLKYINSIQFKSILYSHYIRYTKVPFPCATVTQSKFLCHFPLLSMFHSLEHITFPNWVFLIAHFTGTITFLFWGPEIRLG